MRIQELDGLRGIAVLAVLAQHYLNWLPITGSHNGWLGVDLFFVLSGFLITSILINLRDKEHYFSVFYKRRALRIFPVYFLGIAVYLTASILAGKPGSLHLWAQYIFFYTSLYLGQPQELDYAVILPVRLGLVVLWSLSVEEIYYTFWAPIVRFSTRKAFAAILVTMIFAAPLLRWRFHTPEYPEIYTAYCRMDALAFGSAIALLSHARQANPLAWKHRDSVFDLVAAAMAISTIVLWMFLHGDRSRVLLCTLALSMVDASFALVTFAVLRRSGSPVWWMRALRARWLRSIGMVSYSLYLFHYPIANLLHPWVADLEMSRRSAAIVQTILSFAVSLSVAYGLWYGLESRILRWKDNHVPSPAHP